MTIPREHGSETMAIIKADFTRGSRDLAEPKKEDKPIPRYQLHVSLAFSEPLVWRRIIVPGEITLQKLDEILQICFSWCGKHGHQFYVGKVFYATGRSGIDPRFDETLVQLHTLEEAMRWCFTYMYDAGDGWEHNIEIEEVLVQEKSKKAKIVDGEWAAPPEITGGVQGYAELIYALEHPENEQSRIILEEKDLQNFDPYLFDLEKLNGLLAKHTELN